MPFLLVATMSFAAVAVDAPITAVTVYSDRARVTRTATVTLSGTERVELPLLVDGADPGTIWVDGGGAEVKRVDVARVDAEEFPSGEARALLGKLEALDDKIGRARGDRAAVAAVLDAVRRLQPAPPAGDALRPPPKLNPSGWGAALAFVGATGEKLQARVREFDKQITELERERRKVTEQARLIGGARRRAGYRVTPTLAGKGATKIALTYAIGGARWYPVYDLQLVPDAGRVQVEFAGRVSQETGEDWVDAAITLSTAVPATSTVYPKLLTWKVGERDRFIPTPVAAVDRWREPPRAAPPPVGEREDEVLRQRLLARIAGEDTPREVKGEEKNDEDGRRAKKGSKSQEEYSARLRRLQEAQAAPMDKDGEADHEDLAKAEKPAAPPPPPTSTPTAEPEAVRSDSRNWNDTVSAGDSVRTLEAAPAAKRGWFSLSSGGSEYVPEVVVGGLSPPPGWRRPVYAPDLPASLAGGYDLTFPSLRPETVRSGKGARRVALFAETWPVAVERRLLPALAPEAFLVAEIKNPSARALPGGKADLFVGADPAGTARIKLVAPGEVFTLPLGIDRAVKPVRNVKLVLAEKGFISKDEVSEYLVTNEVVNPYRVPLAVRLVDQIPVTGDKDVEIKLQRADAGAMLDKVKGSLEWKFTVPPSGKSVVTFVYTLKRPKGWRMHQ